MSSFNKVILMDSVMQGPKVRRIKMNKKTNVGLTPGVYRNSCGNQRLLLGGMENKCLYSMDRPEAEVVYGTICSRRTFRSAMGNTPVREFTQAEIKHIADHFNAMRSRRRSNRFEKWLFYSETGKKAIRDLIQKAIMAEPVVEKGWWQRCLGILQKIIAGIKQSLRIQKPAPVSGTLDGEPVPVEKNN